MPDDAGQPRKFRLRPEYHRIAVYALVAAFFIAALILALQVVGLGGSGTVIEALLAGAVLVSGALLLFIFTTRWRIRLDDRGVARRRIFGWDLWSWDAFASGGVKKAEGMLAFTRDDGPFWALKLAFDGLPEGDAEHIYEVCDQRWAPPPAAELPETLQIRLQPPGSARMRLDATGLAVMRRGREQVYGWGDVDHVHIRRPEHNRRDFREMTVRLPDQELSFSLTTYSGSTARDFRGADAELLSLFVQRYVDPARIQITSLWLAPRSLDDVEDRLSRLRGRGAGESRTRAQRIDRIARIMLPFAAGGGLIYMSIRVLMVQPLYGAALLAFCLILALKAYLLFLFVSRRRSAERRRLESWRETLRGNVSRH